MSQKCTACGKEIPLDKESFPERICSVCGEITCGQLTCSFVARPQFNDGKPIVACRHCIENWLADVVEEINS